MTCPVTGWTFPLPWIKQPGMVSHGIDGRTRIAITDQTPGLNLVAWVLPEDADLFIGLAAQLATAQREREEAQAACAASQVQAKEIRDIIEGANALLPFPHALVLRILQCVDMALASSPGRPLLDELARLREERDTLQRKGESLCCWIGVLLTTLHVSTPEEAVKVVGAQADALRLAEEALVEIAESPQLNCSHRHAMINSVPCDCGGDKVRAALAAIRAAREGT